MPENYGTYTAHLGGLGANVYRLPVDVVGNPTPGWGGNTIQLLIQSSFNVTWRLKG